MEIIITAAALGLFDGVHLGHRAVLEAACARRREGIVPVVFTFEPETALNKSGAGYIYGRDVKHRLVKECGIVEIFSCEFNDVRELSGEDFAREIIRYRMDSSFVYCGSDFRFGKNASCGVEELRRFGERFGFEVNVVDSVKLGGETVSSSRIRELLTAGDVGRAAELLGSEYLISAPVAEGEHIGRTIDLPTINQHFGEGQLVPLYGAYSSSVEIDGSVYRAVTNIGVKPTVKGRRAPLAETHIIGYSGDLYGRTVDVRLHELIRPEQKFGSLDELREQIMKDIERAVSF